MRHLTTKEERTLSAAEGWRQASLQQSPHQLSFRWTDPSASELAGLTVQATATLDAGQSAMRWTFRVENRCAEWSVRRSVFPLLDLADLGKGAVTFFPRGPGELQRGVWQRDFHYRGNYPDGWCSMQFLAAYREGPSPTGFVDASHGHPLGGGHWWTEGDG